MKKLILCLGIVLLFVDRSFGYGQTGHEIVGGIADKLLASKPAAAKIKELIDGITLEDAAVMPDEIKSWDRNGPDDARALHYPEHPKIELELRDFWLANPPTHDQKSETPSHHWFHYTDVPVANAVKYSDGQTGRSKWDIVHMIPYCVSVLRGETPENNPRKITKAVAVILLAHYLGDLHQPLHVGAEYFDHGGRAIDPDRTQGGLEDQGGNMLMLKLLTGTQEEMAKRTLKLHSFWDNEAVSENLPPTTPGLTRGEKLDAIEPAKRNLLSTMAATEPKGWRLPPSVPLKDYAEAWANDMLPVAREAHQRLDFTNMRPQVQDDGSTLATGDAREKPTPDRMAYHVWAGKTVREQIHKAGWRLADLLEKSVTSTSAVAAYTPSPTPPAATPPARSTIAPKIVPTLTPAARVNTSAPVAATAAAPASSYGIYPANYKAIVTAWLQTNRLDASQILWQSEPRPADLSGTNGQHLSGYQVVFNSRARGTTTMQTHSVLIRDGRVINSLGFDQ
jgi:S1/P1 Nuclease